MRTALAAFLVLFLGCAAAVPTEAPLLPGAPGKRTLVFVVDETVDAESLATAKLALEAGLELARSEKLDVGVLAALPDGPHVLVSPGEGVAPRLEPVPGRAPLGRSCRRALDALVSQGAPRGSLIVLLAREPGGEDAAEVGRVTDEARKRDLRVLRVPIEKDEVVAVEALAEEAFSYLVALGHPASVTPRGGRIATIEPAPPSSPPGSPLVVETWHDTNAKIALPGSFLLLLYRPDWELTTDPAAPPPIVYLGDQVPFALTVSGPSAQGLPLQGSARSQGKTVPLTRDAAAGGLRLVADLEPPFEEGPVEVAIDLAFSAGEARFELVRPVTYLARKRTGTPPPTLRVTPDRLALGAIWADAPVSATLTIKGDPDRPVKVTLDGAPCAFAAPVELAPGEEKALEVTVDPKKLASGFRLKLKGEVTLVAQAPVRPHMRGERAGPAEAPSAAPPRELGVIVTAEPALLHVPASFDLGKVQAGERLARSFALGDARVTARVVADGDVAASAAIEKGALLLGASPPKGTKPGKRAGRVELALTGSKEPPLVRPMTLEVEGPRELNLTVAPGTLALKGRYGWAEARVRVSSNLAARLEARPGPLAGSATRIAPRRDIRVKSGSASWDARTLAPGEERELVLRVYLGTDLPPGRYEGTLALEARDDSDLRSLHELPVSIEVER
jgi:hypothetical protein